MLEWIEHDGSAVEVDIAYGQFLVVRMAGGLEELYGSGRFLNTLKGVEAYCIANLSDILPPYEKKRWRAKGGQLYYYVTDIGSVFKRYDEMDGTDNLRYSAGNYFSSREEAKASKIYQGFERIQE